MRALDVLDLEADADFAAVKAAYRRLAKENHPDLKQGDKEAAKRFQQVQAAYDVLRRAEERARRPSPKRSIMKVSALCAIGSSMSPTMCDPANERDRAGQSCSIGSGR